MENPIFPVTKFYDELNLDLGILQEKKKGLKIAFFNEKRKVYEFLIKTSFSATFSLMLFLGDIEDEDK